MIYILLVYLIELLILVLFKSFIQDFELVGLIIVIIHVFVTLLLLLVYKKRNKNMYIIAFILRFVFLMWDLYAKEIFLLPGSGADTEFFYRTSIAISENLSLIGNIRGGIYPTILGILYSITGPSRIIGQYINVLLGFFAIYFLDKILMEININNMISKKIILIFTFFPYSIVISSILLREAFSVFFLTISLYYFIKWYKSQSYTFMTLSLIFIVIASSFHSGVIGVALVYTISFISVQPEKNTTFNMKKILISLPIIIGFAILLKQYDNIVLKKFSVIEDVEAFYNVLNYRASTGGSTYLTTMEIHSYIDILKYGPIRMIYFLFSPMLWDVRGLFDLFSIFFDSSLYIYVSAKSVVYLKNKNTNKLFKILVLSFLLSAFIFGMGVSNAGTAIRHRQKLLPIILILWAILSSKKHKQIHKNT